MSRTITIREVQATYSVPIDETALAEGPIIVERQGRAVAVIISLQEYRAFQEWRDGQAWQEEQLRRLEPERQAFQRLLPELLKTHRGQFVAVHGGQVVDTDTDKATLAQRVLSRPHRPIYIQEVAEHPRIYELPSPEVVWRA